MASASLTRTSLLCFSVLSSFLSKDATSWCRVIASSFRAAASSCKAACREFFLCSAICVSTAVKVKENVKSKAKPKWSAFYRENIIFLSACLCFPGPKSTRTFKADINKGKFQAEKKGSGKVQKNMKTLLLVERPDLRAPTGLEAGRTNIDETRTKTVGESQI